MATMTDAAAIVGGPPLDTDALIRQARIHQASLLEHRAKAAEDQRERDLIIRQIRDSDPGAWSYGKIAAAVGLDRQNVIWILRQPVT